MSLRPCPACGRHVRAADLDCPFCDHPVPDTKPSSAPRWRPGRIVRMAFGAALAASTALGCGDDSSPADAGARADAGPSPMDAGPGAGDAGSDAGVGDAGPEGTDAGGFDAGLDAGSPAMPYGAPPVDQILV